MRVSWVSGAWQMRLSERELHTLLCALRVAADQYKQDASTITDAEHIEGMKRLHDQFLKQEQECRQLFKKLGGE
jgi:hypothetical protein